MGQLAQLGWQCGRQHTETPTLGVSLKCSPVAASGGCQGGKGPQSVRESACNCVCVHIWECCGITEQCF